jgi:peptidoglycan/LPS O-acetylase OafA/YrhL
VQGLLCLPWGANPPLWSLGYEWGLYLIAPAIFGALLLPMLARQRLLSCAAVAVVFAGLTLWNPDWPKWFAVWMLGAIAWRVFKAGFVGLPAGIIGLMVCAGGLVVSRTALVPTFVTDWCVAGGLAAAMANPKILGLTGGIGAVRRGADFSYSLYATHLPVCVFIGALMERFAGWPHSLVQPDLRGVVAFIVMVAGALLVAQAFAYPTEKNTAAVRAWLMNLRASLRWNTGSVSRT